MNYPDRILPELLAPAGSFEHMKAALLAGADAVYFGGSRYGARAYAENFTTERVLEALDYLHFHRRRAYMTVNTLIKEKELQGDLYEYLLPFYEAGLDGVIVQDLGAASFIREHFPGMEIHGSTQMMITSVSGALAAGRIGMNRVVPARELTAEEMRLIKEESGLELEVFIHGALCYCYSGQCLFSSSYGGRSGNRGRCAQPCRLPYKAYDAGGRPLTRGDKYLLSPKDLCTLYDLPSILEAGADSLKIEGRMKNVEFVAGVTSIYRKYLDLYASEQPYQVDPEDMHILEELYSRSGFTGGYWYQHNGPDMMSVHVPRHLGRKIGKIHKVMRGKVSLLLDSPVYARDILILPGEGEEEIALTVPGQADQAGPDHGKSYELILNAPSTKTMKAGDPVYRRHNEKTVNMIREEIMKREIRYPVTAFLDVSLHKPLMLKLTSGNVSVRLEGPEPVEADKRALREEDFSKQMKKTGNVPYTLEKLEIHLEPGLFLPASAIKDIRQRAYQELTEALAAAGRPSHLNARGGASGEATFHTNNLEVSCGSRRGGSRMEKIAAIYQEDSLDYCLSEAYFDGIILPMDFHHKDRLIRLKARIRESGKKVYLSLPRVFRHTGSDSMRKYIEDTINDGINWSGIYINNINNLYTIPSSVGNLPRIFSSSFYPWNGESCREITRLNDGDAGSDIFWELPLELSREECLNLLENMPAGGVECMVYGHYPVMLSAQCVKKTMGRCNGSEEIYYLEDRQKRRLPMSSHCRPDWVDPFLMHSSRDGLACYNMIWSDRPRDLIGQDVYPLSDSIGRMRFDFFTSSREEIKLVMRRYIEWEKHNFAGLLADKKKDSVWEHGIE